LKTAAQTLLSISTPHQLSLMEALRIDPSQDLNLMKAALMQSAEQGHAEAEKASALAKTRWLQASTFAKAQARESAQKAGRIDPRQDLDLMKSALMDRARAWRMEAARVTKVAKARWLRGTEFAKTQSKQRSAESKKNGLLTRIHESEEEQSHAGEVPASTQEALEALGDAAIGEVEQAGGETRSVPRSSEEQKITREEFKGRCNFWWGDEGPTKNQAPALVALATCSRDVFLPALPEDRLHSEANEPRSEDRFDDDKYQQSNKFRSRAAEIAVPGELCSTLFDYDTDIVLTSDDDIEGEGQGPVSPPHDPAWPPGS
jgi:hypothetical protein